MAEAETAVGVSGNGDRWFWLRGTLGAVSLLTLLCGQFIVPKFIRLFGELGVEEFPFPLMVILRIDRVLRGNAGYILLDLILLGCVALATVPHRSRAWRTMAWVLVICLVCLAALYAVGLYGGLLTLGSIAQSLSA